MYVRAVDTDQGTGNRALDTLSIDQMFIRVSDPPTVPPDGDPSAMSATAVSASQIDLAWTDGTGNETGFELDRSPDGSAWTQLTVLGPDSTSFEDSGLDAETSYYYRVRAFNANGFSAYTSGNATTQVAPPLGLSAEGYKVKGRHHVDLSWPEFGAVDVYRDPAGGAGPIATGVSASTYTDNIGTKGAATYQHQVCEAGGTRVCSNITTTVF